jgi:hypothetical protein
VDDRPSIVIPTVTEDLITLYTVTPDPSNFPTQIRTEMGETDQNSPVKGIKTSQPSVVVQTLSTSNK